MICATFSSAVAETSVLLGGMTWNSTAFKVPTTGYYEVTSNVLLISSSGFANLNYWVAVNEIAQDTVGTVILNSSMDMVTPFAWTGCVNAGSNVSVKIDSTGTQTISFGPSSTIIVKKVYPTC